MLRTNAQNLLYSHINYTYIIFRFYHEVSRAKYSPHGLNAEELLLKVCFQSTISRSSVIMVCPVADWALEPTQASFTY